MNIHTRITDEKIVATGAKRQRTIPYNLDESLSANHAEAAATLYRVVIQGKRAQGLGLTGASVTVDGDEHAIFHFPKIKL
jgi:hypothetical protein